MSNDKIKRFELGDNMRTYEEIEKQVLNYVESHQSNHCHITRKDIGKALNLSPRFTMALINQMVKDGKLSLSRYSKEDEEV